MGRKLVLLTLHHLPKGREGPFGQDKQYVEIGVYDLMEPVLVPLERSENSLENRVIGQINLDQGQILAAKTFVDKKDSRDILKETIKEYNGVGPVGSENQSFSVFYGQFRITSLDRILKEYFGI